jgi:hypothetical protein
MTNTEAAALAAALELDVDDLAICHACLSFVGPSQSGSSRDRPPVGDRPLGPRQRRPVANGLEALAASKSGV